VPISTPPAAAVRANTIIPSRSGITPAMNTPTPIAASPGSMKCSDPARNRPVVSSWTETGSDPSGSPRTAGTAAAGAATGFGRFGGRANGTHARRIMPGTPSSPAKMAMPTYR
jgi:hypothetical protein